MVVLYVKHFKDVIVLLIQKFFFKIQKPFLEYVVTSNNSFSENHV